MVSTFFDSTPAEFAAQDIKPEAHKMVETEEDRQVRTYNEKVRQYVIGWRNQLRQYRYEKYAIWNECWQLYRGQEDFSDKEDWQSKIVLPKSFSSVKQATNVIKRFLNAAKKPFNVEAENPNDQVAVIRAEQMTNLVRVFLEKAKFLEEFSWGLECGFIIGVGIVKVWWGYVPKLVTRVQTSPTPAGPPGGMGLSGVTDTAGGVQGAAGITQPAASVGAGPQPIAQPNLTGPPGAGPGAYRGAPGVSEMGREGGSGGAVPTNVNNLPIEQQPQQSVVPEQFVASGRTVQPIGQPPRALQHQQAGQYPTQLGNEYISPMNATPGRNPLDEMIAQLQGGNPNAQYPPVQMQKQIIREETLEGRLFLRAVDPWAFYWLPGSKLNRWTGTIEEIECPKWELMEMAEQGVFDPELIKQIMPMKLEEMQKQSWLRFSEMPRTTNGPTADTGVVKLTEYYGPIVLDGKVHTRYGHVLIANDSVTLICGENQFWHRKAPYIGFSPVQLPFRTEGVGLVEMVRQIDKALSRLSNMSVDTLMFRLLPIFEVAPDAYENPEDFDTGMVPGKIFRRNMSMPGVQGLTPIQFEDISSGTMPVMAGLDRYHQEGSLISEIQQGIPRFRGAQTATETQTQQDNQQSFFGSMASEIEESFLSPLVLMAVELLFQFLDTANDPRVASILGIEAGVLAGMSREDVLELIQGDYKIHVKGLTGQLEKAEMLQNLVQFMNLIGQNPQAWLPYVNQDKLLQRILEAFRPAIHDVEQIIADPETAQANQMAMLGRETVTPELIKMLPQLIQMQQAQQAQQQQMQQAAEAHQQQQAQAGMDNHARDVDQALQIAQLQQGGDQHAAEMRMQQQSNQSAANQQSATQGP